MAGRVHLGRNLYHIELEKNLALEKSNTSMAGRQQGEIPHVPQSRTQAHHAASFWPRRTCRDWNDARLAVIPEN